jgi:hypothetical protein
LKTLEFHVEIDEAIERGGHFKQPGAELVNTFNILIEPDEPDVR